MGRSETRSTTLEVNAIHANIEARRKRVSELILQRKSINDICKIIASEGFPAGVQAISRDIMAVRKKWADQYVDIKEVILEDLATLSDAQEILWEHVVTAKPWAFDKLLNILDHRAKLLGLYAPTRQEHTGRDGGPIVIRELSDAELLNIISNHPAIKPPWETAKRVPIEIGSGGTSQEKTIPEESD